MLFCFDVEQMAASAQEKTPAGLTTTNSLDVFLSYCLFSHLALSPEAVFGVLLCCAELCLKLEILKRN